MRSCMHLLIQTQSHPKLCFRHHQSESIVHTKPILVGDTYMMICNPSQMLAGAQARQCASHLLRGRSLVGSLLLLRVGCA